MAHFTCLNLVKVNPSPIYTVRARAPILCPLTNINMLQHQSIPTTRNRCNKPHLFPVFKLIKAFGKQEQVESSFLFLVSKVNMFIY